MPVLPLMNENGDLADDAPLTLLAVMNFPRSLERQTEYYAASWARVITSREIPPDRMSMSPGAVTLLANASPFEQQQKDVQNRFIRALQVGETLALVCCMIQNDPSSASRNKAQYLQRKNLDAEVEADPSLKLTRSERSQHENWREFSPVAHLWAGLLVFSHEGVTDSNDVTVEKFKVKHDDIPRMLGLAEFFRKIGETFVPAGQRPTEKSPSTTILDPDETWKCPEELEIPTVDLDLLFDDDMSWFLSQYNYSKIYGMK